jgi:pimeloyl-[acyl-carrier protein] methyl ester esterase
MKKVILWIHGWGTSPTVWGHDGKTVVIEQELPEFEHEYIDFSACVLPADFVQAIRCQLSQSDADQYILIGWSFGAMLALEAVMTAQTGSSTQDTFSISRITSVVMVSGTLKFTDSDRTQGWPYKIVARMRDKLAENQQNVLQQFRLAMIIPEQQRMEAFRYIQQMDTDLTPKGLEAGLTYLLDTDLRGAWEAFSLSTHRPSLLWIHGSEDTICPVGAMPSWTSALAWVNMDAAAHLPFLSHSKLFYDQLRRFLTC